MEPFHCSQPITIIKKERCDRDINHQVRGKTNQKERQDI